MTQAITPRPDLEAIQAAGLNSAEHSARLLAAHAAHEHEQFLRDVGASEQLTVLRIQDVDGRGPFKPGFSHWWVEERPDHANLIPWFKQFGPMQKAGWPFGRHIGCGCRTAEQLRRWFTVGEYGALRRFGYQAVQLDVERVLAASDIQCVFSRRMALRSGAVAFSLYGESV